MFINVHRAVKCGGMLLVPFLGWGENNGILGRRGEGIFLILPKLGIIIKLH